MHDWQSIVRARLAALPLDPARAAEIVDELAQHAADKYAELRAAGVTEDSAMRRALAVVEGGDRLSAEIATAAGHETTRDIRGPGAWWTDAARDMRYAWRMFRAAPTFASVAILTLGLGIGGAAAIFTVANAVLLKPLPYAAPDRLVLIGDAEPGGTVNNVGYATFVDWRAASHSFSDMVVIRPFTPTMVANGDAQRVTGMRVSWNFFRMLGVAPALGRDFAATDDTPNTLQVLMLSDAFWRRQFNADPGVIGRSVTINSRPFTVVGVMPAAFEPLISEHFYQRAEMWAPLGYDVSQPFACRSCQHLKAIGRLKDGVSPEAARGELNAIAATIRRDHPTDYPKSAEMGLESLRTELMGGIEAVLDLLLGAVGCVLLIAAFNVANLLLSRLSTRQRELALRIALGAGRARVVRQMFVESLVLALAGGALGIAIAEVAVPMLIRLSPGASGRVASASIDLRVLAFVAALSCATAIVFGLLPAIRASRASLAPGLREGDTRATGRSAVRRGLVGIEIVTALVLLTGAGLMIRSVSRLVAVDPGFNPNGVLTTQASFVGPAYAANGKLVSTIDRIVAKLHEIPGVRLAAAAGQVPLGGNFDASGLHIEGRGGNPADDAAAQRYSVTAEYFDALRIPLRRGRLLTAADRSDTEPVIVIGEYAAQKLFADSDPIGQRVRVGDPTTGAWRTIVGIVGDVRHVGLAAAPSYTMYLPQSQLTDAFLTFVVRTDGDPAALGPAMRRAIRDVAPDVPVYQMATLASLVDQSVASRRFVMTLLLVFAVVALALTAVGVYGIVSFAVSARVREIGIRAALGASRADIVRLVVRQDTGVIVAGVVLGLIAALGAARLLTASTLPGLFSVSPNDPVTLLAAAGVLLFAAAVAQCVPVARALRVDPTIALKQ